MDIKHIFRLFSRKAADSRGPLGDFWYRPAANNRDVTPQSALGISAYFAALANISEDMAKLPLPVFEKVDTNERQQRSDHPLSDILNLQFNPDMTAFCGRQTLTQWAMGWGNGYAEIQRNGIGRPVALWPIHPSRVTVMRDENNSLVYRVMGDGGPVYLYPRDMFHIVGRLSDDGVTGISIAQAGYAALSRGMSIQDYGTSLLNAGMSDRIALSHPGKLQSDTPQKIRESWVSLYGGTPGVERGPAILQEGMKVERIGIPPKDAQLLDEAQFTPEDIARFFRCPLSKIGHFLRAQGWSTLETLNTDYVVDTLLPWDVKWSQEARRKLFTANETDLYVSHNFKALMKGDSTARGNWYNLMLRLGIMSRNDIRALEDMNPVEGGDVYYIDSANLREIKPGSDEDETRLTFIRDAVKAFIARNSTGDVVANSTLIGDLVEQSGLPRNSQYKDPYTPVVAANGQMVSGEVIEDEEGDIVGGDVVEPPQPEQPANQPNGQQNDQQPEGDDGQPKVEPTQEAPPEGEDTESMSAEQVRAQLAEAFAAAMNKLAEEYRERAESVSTICSQIKAELEAQKALMLEMKNAPEKETPKAETTTGNPPDGQAENSVTTNDNHLATIRAAAEGALNHAFGRIARKEVKALRKAIKDHLDHGNREAFKTWTTGFYGEMIQELRTELGPHNAVIESITGVSGEFHERCRLHAEGSRLALCNALDSGGSKAVKAFADEWEQGRVFAG